MGSQKYSTFVILPRRHYLVVDKVRAAINETVNTPKLRECLYNVLSSVLCTKAIEEAL